MLEREIVMGGEESGGIGFQRHLPERDGLLNALLLANVMAEESKTMGQLVADLQAEYGEHQYGRIDLHIPDDVKNGAIARAHALEAGNPVFAGMPVLRHETMDGVKFYLDNPEAKTKPQRRRDLAAVARQRDRAAAADLYGVVLEGVGGEAAGIGAKVCDGRVRHRRRRYERPLACQIRGIYWSMFSRLRGAAGTGESLP